MSVFNGIIHILDWMDGRDLSDLDQAVETLGCGLTGTAGFDYENAASVIRRVPSLVDICIGTRVERLRIILHGAILAVAPSWRHAIPYGRGYLRDYLGGSNALQCMEAANLYCTTDDAGAIAWWDRLAGEVRAERNDVNTKQGREAERRTVEFERNRLAQYGVSGDVVKWVALEDNRLGYDVLSVNGDSGPLNRRYIEVKSSILNHPRFILTRNEWETANEYGDNYVVYFWHQDSAQPQIYPFDSLRNSVPVDSGDGRWREVEIAVRTN